MNKQKIHSVEINSEEEKKLKSLFLTESLENIHGYNSMIWDNSKYTVGMA